MRARDRGGNRAGNATLYTALFLAFWLARMAFIAIVPEIRIAPDSMEYLALAGGLEETGTYARNGRAETYRPPGYPVFLFLLRSAGVDSPAGTAAVQAGLYAAQAVLIFHLAASAFGRTAAWIAYALLLFNAGGLVSTASILSEPLFSSALVLTAWIWIVRPIGRPAAHWPLLGALTGGLCLVRPIAQWLFIPLLAAIAAGTEQWRKKTAAMALFLAGVALTQGAWMARSQYLYGSFYVSETSAVNLYVHWAQAAKSECGEGGFGALFEEAWNDWNRAAPLRTPAEMNRMFTTKALEEIRPHWQCVPMVWIKGAARLVLESGWMKALDRMGAPLPLTLDGLKKSLTAPDGFAGWMVASAVLALRMFELTLNALTFLFAAGFPLFLAMRAKQGLRPTLQHPWMACWAMAAYMFALSAGSYANTRFREQFFSLVIMLSAPLWAAALQWTAGRARSWRSIARRKFVRNRNFPPQ